MKLNNRKFSLEMFKSPPEWLSPFLSILNGFISEVYSMSQNNMTISDNLYQEIISITFTEETSNYPIKQKLKFNKYPQMILVGSCVDSDGNYSSVQPLIQWTFADGMLSISSISGLTTSGKYTLKLLVIYG